MRATPLNKQSSSETARCKRRIQGLIREIAIERDGGCIFRDKWRELGICPCGGYAPSTGEIILQFDHLVTRASNASYGVPEMGVTVCKAHHGWKHFTDANKEQYDGLVRKLIGRKRAALWKRYKEDRRSYPMGIWEWTKVEISLKNDLIKLRATVRD